jgi:hypothetical protein
MERKTDPFRRENINRQMQANRKKDREREREQRERECDRQEMQSGKERYNDKGQRHLVTGIHKE